MQNLSKLSLSENVVSIKHLHKLTNEHFIIGDQDQLDVINVNCIVNDYIDSETIWSLNIGKKIIIVVVDIKSNTYLILRMHLWTNNSRKGVNNIFIFIEKK